MDMYRLINKFSNIVSVPVTSLGDIPNLVEALRDWGKFATANLIEGWYEDSMERLHAEYAAPF